MNKTHQLTQAGIEDLNREREKLLKRQAEMSQSIAESREHGDLSENSEYQIAKSKQDGIVARLAEIASILENTTLINQPRTHNQISLGSKVGLKNKTTDESITYDLVGTLEADPIAGKISNESPLGRALIGKTVGDQVTVKGIEVTTDYIIKTIS